MSAVKARDRAGWLALFEDDAVVEDPVGPCEWDPAGQGQRGKAAIGGFYDMFSAAQEAFDFEVHHLATGGSEVAAFVTLHFTFKDGSTRSQKVISVYKASPAGKIASLRAFWN
jgi:steroid delta-isomerase